MFSFNSANIDAMMYCTFHLWNSNQKENESFELWHHDTHVRETHEVSTKNNTFWDNRNRTYKQSFLAMKFREERKTSDWVIEN